MGAEASSRVTILTRPAAPTPTASHNLCQSTKRWAELIADKAYCILTKIGRCSKLKTAYTFALCRPHARLQPNNLQSVSSQIQSQRRHFGLRNRDLPAAGHTSRWVYFAAMCGAPSSHEPGITGRSNSHIMGHAISASSSWK